jgi:Cytochrome domain of cellobiose dehydrogenase
MRFSSLLALVPLLGSVLAQQSVSQCDTEAKICFQGLTDPVHGVSYRVVFPPLVTSGANSTEFIGEIVAPVAVKWAAIALGLVYPFSLRMRVSLMTFCSQRCHVDESLDHGMAKRWLHCGLTTLGDNVRPTLALQWRDSYNTAIYHDQFDALEVGFPLPILCHMDGRKRWHQSRFDLRLCLGHEHDRRRHTRIIYNHICGAHRLWLLGKSNQPGS